MEKTSLENFVDIIKSNGAVGIIAILLFYFGSSFNTRLLEFNNRLSEISKEIVQIKIQLAEMNATYSSKEETRKMIEQAISKHVITYHQKDILKKE